MINILLSEYERTFKRKKTIIGLIAYCFFLAFECFFLFQGISFYDSEHSVQLNSMNIAPFYLRELGLFINFILIPMFVIDSFNGEHTSGALRLVLIRPQKRVKLFFAKWIVQASIFFVITVFTWTIATVFGKVFMPYVSETTFFNTASMSPSGSLIYTLTFYGITYLMFLCVIGISSFMSVIMPNSILAFIGTIAVLIGGIYVSDHFSYFVTVSDSIFKVLGEPDNSIFYLSLFLLFFISNILNVGIWKWKQWMG